MHYYASMDQIQLSPTPSFIAKKLTKDQKAVSPVVISALQRTYDNQDIDTSFYPIIALSACLPRQNQRFQRKQTPPFHLLQRAIQRILSVQQSRLGLKYY